MMSLPNAHKSAAQQDAAQHVQIDQCMPELLEIISKRFGIKIHDHQFIEAKKITRAFCTEYKLSPAESVSQLRTCAADSPFLTALVEGITIGETCFFRDSKQIELLEKKLLPQLIHRKRENNNPSLRVWSAGCSSGEELYTLAILLHQLLPDLSRWTLHLLGTDINVLVLRKAINAKYGEWAMRSTPEKMRKAYFTEENGKYILSPAISRMCKFNYLNLNDESWPSFLNGTSAIDLILCRNVLIYFDDASVARLMHKMYQALVPGGWLLLGASDPVNISMTGLVFHHEDGLLFGKPEILSAVRGTANDLPSDLSSVAGEIPVAQQARQSVHSPHRKLDPGSPSLPLHNAVPPSPLSLPALQSVSADAVCEDRIDGLLKEGKWEDVLSLTGMPGCEAVVPPFVVNARATALASLGRLQETVDYCEQQLVVDAVNNHLRMMLAMALAGQGELARACVEFGKILFIDRRSVMAHYQLGMLQFRNKKPVEGMKSLKNALQIARSAEKTAEVPGCQGMSYAMLVGILEREVEIHAALQQDRSQTDHRQITGK